MRTAGRARLLLFWSATLLLVAIGCSSDPAPTVTGSGAESSTSTVALESTDTSAAGGSDAAADELFPDVIDATATSDGEGTWRFDVTISSPYDSPEQYADAWRVLGPDGTEYGIRVLTHDHAGEQPFTRSQGGIAIPPEVDTVTIEGRDLRNGWGGATLELTLPE